MLNTSVTVLFRRLKEKHTGIIKIFHPIQHYIIPSIATGVFSFVVYESVNPPVFPVTQAVEASVIVLIILIIYSLFIRYRKPWVLEKAGKRVNIVEEELLDAFKKENDSSR